jgi:hypothetical protein
MTLRIATGKSAATVILALNLDHDFESGRLRSGIDCISVRNHKVGSLGYFPTDICRLADVPAVLVINNGAEHHHAVAEGQLCMRYRAVRGFVDCVLLKAEYITKPSNGSFGVAIA